MFANNDAIKNAVESNGIDWYAVVTDDGSLEVKHYTSLSAILQCGHSPQQCGYTAIYQCGYEFIEK